MIVGIFSFSFFLFLRIQASITLMNYELEKGAFEETPDNLKRKEQKGNKANVKSAKSLGKW